MIDKKMMEKAELLIEALPYIRHFHKKTIVIKYGGSAMVDEELKESVMQDAALLKLIGFRPILVHGGGNEISRWLKIAGEEPVFKNGLRVTDEKALEVAEMVLGKINKDLVCRIENLGVKAIGISGQDGGLIKVEKAAPEGEDIGFVGNVKEVDTGLLHHLLNRGYLPIIYPIGTDENGQSYNVNADHVANGVAKALEAEKLVFLSDIPGVMKDPANPDSVIAEIYPEEAKAYMKEGIITGGMLPKMNMCLDAIDHGVTRVHIIDGTVPHCMLLEFFTDKGVGTAIMDPSEDRYYKAAENN